MKNPLIIKLLLVLLSLFGVSAVMTQPPVWGSCQKICAFTLEVVSSLSSIYAGASTVIFPMGKAYSTPPRIASALQKVSSYQPIGSNIFYAYSQDNGQTQTTFTILIQVVTQIYCIQIRYLVFDQTFDGYIDMISNVMFGNGTYSSVTTTQINVTSHLSFDLSHDVRVLFFLTCFSYTATAGPPILNVTGQMVGPNIIHINWTIGTVLTLGYIHGCFIVYDQTDILGRNIYKPQAGTFLFAGHSGGEIEIYKQFQSGTLMGISDFNSSSIGDFFDFNLVFRYLANYSYGIYFAPPTPSGGGNTLDYFRFTTFYIEQMFCNDTNYFLDVTSLTCILCPALVNSCLTPRPPPNQCFCSSCDTTRGFFLFANNSCGLCDPSINYFMNLSDPTHPCLLCVVTHCVQCSNLTSCQTCNTSQNYILDSATLLCQQCTLNQCTKCLNLLQCIICNIDNNYVLNPSTFLCQVCPLNECLKCQNYTACQTCDLSINYVFNPSTLHCQLCSLNQCLQCQNYTACQTCDISINYVLNPTLHCQLCPLTQCLQCINYTACQTCNLISNYVLNPTLLCQPCPLSHCLQCINYTACQTCDLALNSVLNPSTQLCQSCPLPHCLQCQNISICQSCDLNQNYVLTSEYLCEKCSLSHCIQCANISACQKCDQNQNYILNAETNQCFLFVTISPSLEKQGCNGFVIKFSMSNEEFQNIKNTITIFNEGISITNMQVSQTDQIVQIHAQYTKSLVNKPIIIQIFPSQNLTLKFNPVIPPVQYTQKQCQVPKQVSKLATTYLITSYIFLFFSLFSCKIVGLELFGVLQLAYFSLSQHDFLNIYLAPLATLKSLNGLNINISHQPQILDNILATMGIYRNFINNCNIMVLLMLAFLLIGLVLFLAAYCLRDPKIQNYSSLILRQVLVTLILFNCFNISFSAGIHWKYAKTTDQFYDISTLLLIISLGTMLVAAILMQLSNQVGYGQFKKKFKQGFFVHKMFIPLTILYRMCLGFYCGIKGQEIYSTLVTFGIALAFILYVLVNLPFKQACQNYRSCICHVTTVFILFTANYYRTMKSNTPMEIKAKIFSPAIIQLILIGLCIVVSLAVLIYEIIQNIRNYQKGKKIKEELTQNVSQEEIFTVS